MNRQQWEDDWVDYWQRWAAFRRVYTYEATRILAAWSH